MAKLISTRALTASFLALASLSPGCSDSPLATRPGNSPAPPPPSSAPSIATVSPDTGSTGGSTPLVLIGTEFRAGATVTLGGIPVQGRLDSRDPRGTVMYLETPAHAAEVVDVVVTNPGGQSGRLAGAYTYASPDSFDFNGTWRGHLWDGSDQWVEVSIADNLLVKAACEGSELALSPLPSVGHGEFSFGGVDDVRISGRIVSASQAVGTIKIGSCNSGWRAVKQ